MKLVISYSEAIVKALYLDTDTVILNGSGLTVNGKLENADIHSGRCRLIEDVTAEAFLVGINNLVGETNHEWRYYER